jgi:ribonuclease P protein component
VKVLLSVPKRKLRHAVDRNRAKRQLREAYRLNKAILMEALQPKQGLHIAFMWLSDKPIESTVVEKKLINLLQRVGEQLRQEYPIN